MSDDGWIPLPDVSRGPAHAPPPPPAPPLDLAPPPLVTPVPAAPPQAAPKRRRRGLVAALAAVIALGGAGAAGAIVVTRDDADDGGDSGDSSEGIAVEATPLDGQPIAPEYLDETNPFSSLSFPFAEETPSLVAPCSEAGALDELPTTSSGAAGSTEFAGFSVLAGSFATAEDAEYFRSQIAAVTPCQYWHPDYLETLNSVESYGDEVWLYYDLTDRDGNDFSGVDVYIVSGKVVGVVACSVWAEEGWPQCEEVVETFAGKVYDVDASHG